MLIEMTIKGLMVDPITNMPIVILKDKEGERVLPIWVGIFEANAIALQIENVAHAAADDPRPAAQHHHRPRRPRRPRRGQRPEGQHLLRHHPPDRRAASGRRRRAAERRHCPGAADAGADPGGGDGHRQRQDRRLRARRRPTATACRSGSKASIPKNLASTRCRLSAGRPLQRTSTVPDRRSMSAGRHSRNSAYSAYSNC